MPKVEATTNMQRKLETMLKGGCYCGRIRYEAAGMPFHETNCHCSICRRFLGAAYGTFFQLPRDQVRLGAPWVRVADDLPRFGGPTGVERSS